MTFLKRHPFLRGRRERNDLSRSNPLLRILLIFPEILLSMSSTVNPGWKEPALDLPRPRIRLILVRRDNATTADLLKTPRKAIKRDIASDTSDQTVGNTVCKRHDSDSKERGDRITIVPPVDISGSLSHHRTDNHERATRGPGWNRSEDRGEEYGDEEGNAGDAGCQACLAALGNPGAGLDECCDGGTAQEGSDRDGYRVNHIGHGAALEILGLLVDCAGKSGHGVHCTCGIQDIDILRKTLVVNFCLYGTLATYQKCDESQSKFRALASQVPILSE